MADALPHPAAAAFFDGPHPLLPDVFALYARLYFDDALGPTSVRWSSARMTLCAGMCTLEAGGGIVVRLSAPILSLRPFPDLANTLLHELIHAWLFATGRHAGDGDHGPLFQAKAAAINAAPASDADPLRPLGGYRVTLTHDWREEVALYRTHEWRCEACGATVARASNRPPQPADCPVRRPSPAACAAARGGRACAHHAHEAGCGGTWVKTRAPEPTRRREGARGRPAPAAGAGRPRNQPTLAAAWGRGQREEEDDVIVLSSSSEEGG
jgi:hypothetical protein